MTCNFSDCGMTKSTHNAASECCLFPWLKPGCCMACVPSQAGCNTASPYWQAPALQVSVGFAKGEPADPGMPAAPAQLTMKSIEDVNHAADIFACIHANSVEANSNKMLLQDLPQVDFLWKTSLDLVHSRCLHSPQLSTAVNCLT